MSAATIEKLCLKARQAIAQREWDKAKQAYLQALGLKSDMPDVHYGLATVYFQLRELTSAAHHFREVTRLDPLRAGAFVNLGAVLNLMGEYDEAIGILRRGIQVDASRVEAYYNLGLVYKRKGQLDLAIQAYREALRLNPRMADAYLNLANVYLDKEQHRQAVQNYEEALKLRPGWEKALDGLTKAQAGLSADRPIELSTPVPVRAPSAGSRGMDRVLDPTVHGGFLTDLHQATIAAEEIGREMQQILQGEIEPAIKDLSSCLLYPDGPRSELDDCVQRFEAALEKFRAAQQAIRNRVAPIRKYGEKVEELP
jgi:tetratricopeptide (TPR) repeat protein